MKEKKMTKKDISNLKMAQEKIEEKKNLPEEILTKINNRVFQNIIVAIIIVGYLYFINLASINIPTETLVIDLKVFSIITILLTIGIFEYSYKKDSGIMWVFGIESLFVSVATLFLAYLYTTKNTLFQLIVAWLSLAVSIYYVMKSIIIYFKIKKDYYKSMSDINDIVKKEK